MEPEFPPEGRKQSLTNIAPLTGIHRHEVELLSRDTSLEFFKDINQFFEAQDRDAKPTVKGSGRNRAGIGLYYFQEKVGNN